MPEARGGTPGYLGISRRPTRREWRRVLIVFAVGTMVLVLLLLFLRPRANLLAVGAAAPAINLAAAGGGQVSVPAAAAGKPFVLEFFEAGCAQCQQAASQLCGEKVPVFAVDAAKDSTQAILDYRHQYAPGCSYPMLVDPDLTASGAYAVNVVPTVYLVKDGRIVYSGSGLDGVAGLAAAVQKALGG